MPKPTPGKKSKTAGAEPVSFESALHRLEAIVTQLEQADAPLEQALTLYEEGVRLARFCSEQLKAAERRVEILEDKNGTLRPAPFCDDDEEAGEASAAPEDLDEEDDDDESDAPPKTGGHPQDSLF